MLYYDVIIALHLGKKKNKIIFLYIQVHAMLKHMFFKICKQI